MEASERGTRFIVNIFWNWAGLIVVFFAAFFLSPYLIRKLGEQRYGLWILAFAFIDYFILFDFGFKPAIVNMVARARGNDERVNDLINTALFYFLGVGAMLATVTWSMAGELHRLFQISPELREDFAALVRLIAIGWGTAIGLGVFNAATEAFQLFRAQSVIGTSSAIFRSVGCAAALYLGFGLSTLGWIVLLSQAITFGALAWNFRRVFPALSISPSRVSWQLWKAMGSYGVYAFVGHLGIMMLSQGPAMLVGHFRTEAFVGYYALPSRLLQNLMDLVTRTGYVTVPNTAEMAERKEFAPIARMGMYLNRYCFALFAPVGVYLLLFGRELIEQWVGPLFGEQSTPLLLPFVVMTGLAIAGQFNSGQILFGLTRHQTYSYLLVAEALTSLALMALVLPRYGLREVAWVSCGVAILNRGLLTPWLLSRILHFPYFPYLIGIFARAITLAAGLYGVGWGIRQVGVTGRNWFELIGSLGFLALLYYGAALFLLVEREHRAKIFELVRGRFSGQSRVS